MRKKLKYEKIKKKYNKIDKDSISLCSSCGCMTYTIKDKSEIKRCSKCGTKKK